MWLLHGMVKGKVFIVDLRERTARDIWKGPEQRNSGLYLASRLDLAIGEAGAEQRRGGRGEDSEGRQGSRAGTAGYRENE